mgnify:CR=1 FL=1
MKRTGANPRGEGQPKLEGRRPRLASKRPARPWQIPEAAKAQARTLLEAGTGRERVLFAVYAELTSDPTQTLPADAFDRVKRLVKGLSAEVGQKVARKSVPDLVFPAETPAGTEPISKEEFSDAAGNTPPSLPESPPKLWPGRPAGRPTPESNEMLLGVIREVYGPYMAGHRDSLRDYIYRNDRKLYSAITNYERRADLPSDIGMTKRSERVLSRLQRAAAQNGFEGMSQSERRSVVGKLTRPRKPSPG